MRAFARNPVRFVARRLFRFSLSLGILGISFGLGGIGLAIRIPFLSFFFKLFGRRRGSGRSSRDGGGGGSHGSGGGGGADGGGEERGGDRRDGSSPSGPRGAADGSHGERGTERVRGAERVRSALERARASLRERRKRLRSEDGREVRQHDAGVSPAPRKADAQGESEVEDRPRDGRESTPPRDEQPAAGSGKSGVEEQASGGRDTADRESTSDGGDEVRDQEMREVAGERGTRRETTSAESHDGVQGERETRQGRARKEPAPSPRSAPDAGIRGAGRGASGAMEFDLSADLQVGARILLEASAGTGKTYSLTSLVARYVAEMDLTMDGLLMVTFTKAAAAEMRERTRAKLGQALRALEAGVAVDELGGDAAWLAPIIECDEAERSERARRLRDAFVDVDSATITTIHGFFQQALKEIGLKSADVATAEIGASEPTIGRQVLRDELVRRYTGSDPPLTGSDLDMTPSAVEARLGEVVRLLDANVSAVAAPSGESDHPVANEWARFVSRIRSAIHGRRAESGLLSFDDLVTGMHAVVDADNPHGAATRDALRKRYRLVLIDEFQDTDDLQWDIFSRIFDADATAGPTPTEGQAGPFLAMIMVGDPKQAIYRFRGADIAAYLRAIDAPGMVRFEMRRNFRSDPGLIAATNRLFGGAGGGTAGGDGFRFGHRDIAYVQVSAGRKGEAASLRVGSRPDAAKPLQIRWVATNTKPKPTVDVVRPAIAEDLANHVATLLNDGRLPFVRDGREPGERRVGAGDICVLVRNHADADPVVDALRGRAIPVVKSSVGSVVDSPAAEQWRLLLSAMAAPGDGRRVKALGLGWFVGLEPEDLLDEETVARLAQRCATWAEEVASRGAMGFYQSLRAEKEVVDALHRSSEVDRRLTDLEHVAEILHRGTNGRLLTAASLLRAMDDLATATIDEEIGLRRIESDAAAVQVMTMHAAKGLEFPIVLVPYPKAPNNKGPNVYSHGGRRYVDAAPDVEWSDGDLDKARRKSLSQEEILGDELRIMYVAYTRARHQLVLWWANTHGMASSPLAKLIFGDHADPTKKTTIPSDEGASLAGLVGRIGTDVAHLEEVPLRGAPVLRVDAPPVAQGVVGREAAFPANARGRNSMRRWSFSSMSRVLKEDVVEEGAGGGRDEGRDGASAILESGEGPASYPRNGLLTMPAGTTFGTLVHAILEEIDPSSTDVEEQVNSAVARHGAGVIPGADLEQLVAGLLKAVRTPLGPFFLDKTLADVGAGDRLPEMEFHFALPASSRPASSRDIAMAAAMDDQSPFAGYFAELGRRWSDGPDQPVSGLMTGSIDALLRLGTGDRPRFFVVDYKSNRLDFDGDTLDHRAYGQENLRVAMEAHQYPLQALLYCVALHRFLSTRLAGYDLDRDLGGAGYLFLRGMVGADTPVVGGAPNGVLGWRPSSETILRVNSILKDGGA